MGEMRFTETVGAGALSIADDGTFPIALITPGKGTSGYYAEELIKRDAPKAFPKGTHVYLDHLKEGETRSPEKLLGYLTEDTSVDDEGVAKNRFKPLSKHREWIEEIAPLVGFSVSVQGKGSEGQVDGEKTIIVESLTPHVTNTVDIVSYAGRGGKFLESFLMEANQVENRTQPEPSDGTTEGSTVTEEQIEALAGAIVAGLSPKLEALEAAVAPKEPVDADEDRAAAVAATVAVESADIAASTKERLIEGIKAGKYDVEAEIAAEKSLREEIRTELTESLGVGAGASAAGGGDGDAYAVSGWGK